MKVEIISEGNLLSTHSFQNWKTLQRFMLRWLSQSVHISFRFEHLQEQVVWYSDLTDLINCAQSAQKSITRNPWKVTIYGFDKAIRAFNHKAA